MDDTYRAEIKTQAQFNRVKSALENLDSIRLAAFGRRGQSYILLGHEEIKGGDADKYIDEINKRLIGYLNSNSVRVNINRPPRHEIIEAIRAATSGRGEE
jgi:hypothetical protein